MSEKTNILFITTNIQRADHFGCASNPDLNTPCLCYIKKKLSLLFNTKFLNNKSKN